MMKAIRLILIFSLLLTGVGITTWGYAASQLQDASPDLSVSNPEVAEETAATGMVDEQLNKQRAEEYRKLATNVSVETRPGVVQCANLIYGNNETSVCFADAFLAQAEKDTNIRTNRRFHPVKMESPELALFPFSVMTGDGTFSMTDSQRVSVKRYLENGGFIIASASCSSPEWNNSFKTEMQAVFPNTELKKLEPDHPIFSTVYDLKEINMKHGASQGFYGLEIDGRVVMIFSPDGLNDTSNAGPHCCCCGGNEIRQAKQMNVNILAYALTH